MCALRHRAPAARAILCPARPAARGACLMLSAASAEMSAIDESPAWRVGIAQRRRGPTVPAEVTQRRGCCTARHAAPCWQAARICPCAFPRSSRPPQLPCLFPRAPAIKLTVPASDMLAPPSPSELRDWLQVSRELEQQGSSHEAVSTHDRKSARLPAPLLSRFTTAHSPPTRPVVSLKHSPALSLSNTLLLPPADKSAQSCHTSSTRLPVTGCARRGKRRSSRRHRRHPTRTATPSLDRRIQTGAF